jgi:hypothetical protein
VEFEGGFLITPVTVRGNSLLKVMVLPTGSSSGKYLPAISQEITTDMGWARAEAASPRTRGNVNISRKTGSTARRLCS